MGYARLAGGRVALVMDGGPTPPGGHLAPLAFEMSVGRQPLVVNVGPGAPGTRGHSTVEVAGEGCRYDLRFTFANGRAMVYRNIDICRYSTVRIRPLPRRPGALPGQ